MKTNVYTAGPALIGLIIAFFLTVAMLFTAGWNFPPIHSSQSGYRGTGMDQLVTPSTERLLKLANALPDPIDPASPDGKRAKDVYKNIQVLTDLSEDQFNRTMLALASWVAPQDGDNAGCAYCHNTENMADDSLYTKKVARRMIQMTRHLNQDWKTHVGLTGVTCYTCHRGQPVPKNIWFSNPGPPRAGGFATNNNGFGHPNKVNGSSEMTLDPLTPTLEGSEEIRVEGTEALPSDFGASIQTTEQTYSLMMYISTSLGVNCTFCHNTRAISQWAQSSPQRVTAWYGIRLARDLNVSYLDPLVATLPANRLGPTGDSPKVGCATCHQGANKPLLGVSMAQDWPELGGTPVAKP
jgi:photosynthetic reaction center cytochrome c subunit